MLAIWVTTAACGAPTPREARAAWLQSTLTDDNRDLLWRSPKLVAQKYVKMRSTPYNFLRGTVLQWIRDLTQPGAVDLHTQFGSPETARVLIDGDPHPENLGSFLPADGTPSVELNDFDAARYGPYWADLWRMAQGFEVLARGARQTADEATIETIVRACALGYSYELAALSTGADPLRVVPSAGYGAIVDDLLRRARRSGDAQDALRDYTELQAGVRRLRRGELEAQVTPGLIEAELRDVDDETRAMLTQAIARYRSTLVDPALTSEDALTIKDVAQQLGSGVSSFALLRYYVLVEGPSLSQDDDWILEAKEIRDPASFPALPILPSRRHTSNAERVVTAQRSLQFSPDADPLLGFADSGGFSLRIRHRTPYQKGISSDRIWEKLSEGDFTAEDVRVLAQLSGRLLARSHAQAPLAHGAPALPALSSAVGDNEDAFATEVYEVGHRYTQQLLEDYTLFVELLDSEGPLLGYRDPLP